MKLLVQGDDYGFTKAVTYGIREGIQNGILRNTGLFTNMPSAKLAVSLMKEMPEACFGIDFNIVSGPSVCDQKDIPHLVDENGEFIRSGARLKDPKFATEEGRRELSPYDETYREIRAQYDKFVEMTGKKPGYLHAHSLMHENYMDAIRAVSEETGIPFSMDLQKKYGFISMLDIRSAKGIVDKASQKKVFDPSDQLNKNPLKDVLDNFDELLKHDYVCIGGHPGFVDADLLDLTTLSLERVRDLQMVTSPVLRKLVEDNKVELITYYDLY